MNATKSAEAAPAKREGASTGDRRTGAQGAGGWVTPTDAASPPPRLIGQCTDIADGQALDLRLQQAAHDLARACLG